jgi:hypothetical protein
VDTLLLKFDFVRKKTIERPQTVISDKKQLSSVYIDVMPHPMTTVNKQTGRQK